MKEVPYQSQEAYKERLMNDLQTIANTPILTNLSGGENTTATAVRFKLIGLEQAATQKERSFKAALLTRFKGMLNIINLKKGTKYSIDDIMIQFHRNVPENEIEKIDMITKLTGIISEESQLEQIPFIDDVPVEIARKKAERKQMFEESVENGSFAADDTQGFAADEKEIEEDEPQDQQQQKKENKING